jgi:hypothetical protein
MLIAPSHFSLTSGTAPIIEIGAGNGTLAHGLKIPATDNKMQDAPMIQLYYKAMGQPTINYPEEVEKIDAIAAIKKYKPHTVIASWMTHKWIEEEHDKGGNEHAPDEREIMELVDKYILIGNMGVHKENRLWDTNKYDITFLDSSIVRSRAKDQSANFIVEFQKK